MTRPGRGGRDISPYIGYNAGMARFFLPFAALLLAAQPGFALTLTEVRDLLAAGIDETTLREQIRSEGDHFRLDAPDLVQLHEAGASSEFLQFLIRTKPPEEVAGETGQRRYLQEKSDGRMVLVLTNLDAAGNRLPDDPSETKFTLLKSRDWETAPDRSSSPPTEPYEEVAGPLVQVVVNPPAQVPAPPLYPYRANPVYFSGGIVGSFEYPERLPFLGYTVDNRFPRFFTGMGMPLFNDLRRSGQGDSGGKTRAGRAKR